jgi:hypothetical protein
MWYLAGMFLAVVTVAAILALARLLAHWFADR